MPAFIKCPKCTKLTKRTTVCPYCGYEEAEKVKPQDLADELKHRSSYLGKVSVIAPDDAVSNRLDHEHNGSAKGGWAGRE